jgi:hypothetical protein
MNTVAKAAEKDVESAFLRAGWNTSVPAVDAGVDLLAIKSGRIVRVQVKSCCRPQADGSYRFDIRRKSRDGSRVRRDWTGDVDYLFFVAGPRLMWAARSIDCVASALHLREGDSLAGFPEELLV